MGDVGLEPETNPLTEHIIGAAIEIHRVLGPGFWNRPTKSAWLDLVHTLSFLSVLSLCLRVSVVHYFLLSRLIGAGIFSLVVTSDLPSRE